MLAMTQAKVIGVGGDFFFFFLTIATKKQVSLGWT